MFAQRSNVDLVQASEFECSSQIAKNSTIIVLSRSGKSIKYVHLLALASEARCENHCNHNTAESPLAQAAEIT
jgi:fructoselysine-6-P-deglycase FrlB-like protein